MFETACLYVSNATQDGTSWRYKPLNYFTTHSINNVRKQKKAARKSKHKSRRLFQFSIFALIYSRGSNVHTYVQFTRWWASVVTHAVRKEVQRHESLPHRNRISYLFVPQPVMHSKEFGRYSDQTVGRNPSKRRRLTTGI